MLYDFQQIVFDKRQHLSHESPANFAVNIQSVKVDQLRIILQRMEQLNYCLNNQTGILCVKFIRFISKDLQYLFKLGKQNAKFIHFCKYIKQYLTLQPEAHHLIYFQVTQIILDQNLSYLTFSAKFKFCNFVITLITIKRFENGFSTKIKRSLFGSILIC